MNAHRTYPDLWRHVSDAVDWLLVREFQKCQSKGTTRTQFLRTWKLELSLFVDMKDAVEIKGHSEDDATGEIDAAKLEELATTLIGSEMFAPERATVEVRCYVEEIQSRLREMEHQDFSASEVSAFRKLCRLTPRHSRSTSGRSVWTPASSCCF